MFGLRSEGDDGFQLCLVARLRAGLSRTVKMIITSIIRQSRYHTYHLSINKTIEAAILVVSFAVAIV